MLFSPFEDILHTNTVPSDAQSEEMRSFLTPHRQALNKLDDEVQRLERLLENVNQQRKELYTWLAAHDKLLSPMRRLPDDVVRVVFAHTLPTTRHAALSADEGPLLLTSICRHWRELALSTPRLWAAVHVVLPREPDGTSGATLASQVSTWIGRSGAVPLSVSMVHVRRGGRLGGSALPGPSLLSSTLLPAAHRWGSMQLRVYSLEDGLALCNLSVEDVPKLWSLGLNLSRVMIESDVPAPGAESGTWWKCQSMRIAAAPTLRHFNFHGPLLALPRTIAWHVLVVLHIQLWAGPADEIVFPFPFLQDCVSLEVLEASANSGISFMDPTHTVLLPRLRRLAISVWQPNGPDVQHGLQLLRLPTLESLDLTGTFLGQQLPDLLQPLAHITQLTVPVSQMLTVDLAHALSFLPALATLRMQGEPAMPVPPGNSEWANGSDHVDSGFMQRFIPGTPGDALLCPALTTLELTYAYALPDALIVQLIRARTPLLSAFRACIFRRQQLDVREALADLLETSEFTLVLAYRNSGRVYSPLEGTERSGQTRVNEDWLYEPDPMLVYNSVAQ
ncbi:F-box domain-containing protein [Mycena indigotica]|uniref:F-box domain-containing protein n=1 Tax=Mycena indigotica TaxID=2126181 RepID=A0A8H6T4M6_9AGAR|nr:F-box domain-containing protein [Mycena indigotica]KAF7310166.1 F-box domain-containing protein [Mycena indigotica]